MEEYLKFINTKNGYESLAIAVFGVLYPEVGNEGWPSVTLLQQDVFITFSERASGPDVTKRFPSKFLFMTEEELVVLREAKREQSRK